MWTNEALHFNKALRYLEKHHQFTFDIYVKVREIASCTKTPRDQLLKEWNEMVDSCKVLGQEPKDFYRRVLVTGINGLMSVARNQGEID